jgi:NAD(P)-dependent dehydrogenase (short-subunit alcohol dehydrogenase family)
MKLDLNSFEAVRQFAKEFNSKYEKLDILVNNAAVMLNPEKELKTEDGFEIHFGVNHLGHFLLTRLLLDKLVKAEPSRFGFSKSYK